MQAVCSAVAVVLQYLFLVVFMWMLMEGVVLYVALVRVFVEHHLRYILTFTAASYGNCRLCSRCWVWGIGGSLIILWNINLSFSLYLSLFLFLSLSLSLSLSFPFVSFIFLSLSLPPFISFMHSFLCLTVCVCLSVCLSTDYTCRHSAGLHGCLYSSGLYPDRLQWGWSLWQRHCLLAEI